MRPADANKGEWSCGAFQPRDDPYRIPYRCTRPHGHDSDHAAHGHDSDRVLASWPPLMQ